MAYAEIPEPGTPIQLREFFLEDRRFPAVYFLYLRGEVVYVGQTKTLRFRIDQHITDGVKQFDAVGFLKCPVNLLLKWEAHFIKRLAPKYNNCGVTKKARQRASWKLDQNRRNARRSRFEGPDELNEDGSIKTCDARTVVLAEHEIGEFFGITESDASALIDAGALPDRSLPALLHFFALNSRVMSAAQKRFEDL